MDLSWELLVFSLSEVSHLYIVASSKLSHRTFAVTVATLSRAHRDFFHQIVMGIEPIPSMYGLFTFIYYRKQLNVPPGSLT